MRRGRESIESETRATAGRAIKPRPRFGILYINSLTFACDSPGFMAPSSGVKMALRGGSRAELVESRGFAATISSERILASRGA